LQRVYDVDIIWIAFPLHPEIPEEGLTLEELFRGRSGNVDDMRARLRRVAEEEGLPLGDRRRTYNSRLAQELGKWAEELGKGKEFHAAVFKAYFADGKNIGKIPVLADLAGSLGLSPGEAKEVLETRAFKEAVDRDWERCHIMGVRAVPTFLMGNETLVGAHPYETLEKFMIDHGVRKR
jgi:predicted DsbA family dithiol-disulfide isomerase